MYIQSIQSNYRMGFCGHKGGSIANAATTIMERGIRYAKEEGQIGYTVHSLKNEFKQFPLEGPPTPANVLAKVEEQIRLQSKNKKAV